MGDSDLRAAAALVACDPDQLDSDYGYDEDVDSDAAGLTRRTRGHTVRRLMLAKALLPAARSLK